MTSEKKTSVIIPSATDFNRDPSTLASETTRSTAVSILTILRAAKVEFLRYAAIDIANGMRCKAIPLSRIEHDPDLFFEGDLSVAEAAFGGLPYGIDHLAEGCGLSAARAITIEPDITTLRILPYNTSTAMIMGTLKDHRTESPSPLCARHLLQRVKQTAETDFGLCFTVGCELEFILFKESSAEPVDYSVYGNPTSLDQHQAFITDLYQYLAAQSIDIEQIHAESAPGQIEVVLSKQEDILRIADNVVFARETIRACARKHKLKAMFLPKVFADETGNGTHIHISFRDLTSSRLEDCLNAFRRVSVYGEISDKGSCFLEGILEHLPALLSITIPSNNSFKRVGPGCFTGHSLGWAIDDKESPLRVCIKESTQEPTNVELKLSDSRANIYLELAAVLTAGLDGIRRQLKLRPMMSDGGEDGQALPKSLKESLEHLEKDQVLLGMMGEKLSKAYIAVKKEESALILNLAEEVSQEFERS